MAGYKRVIRKAHNSTMRQYNELNKNNTVKELTLPNGNKVHAEEVHNTSGSTSYKLTFDNELCGYLPKTYWFNTKEAANAYYLQRKKEILDEQQDIAEAADWCYSEADVELPNILN